MRYARIQDGTVAEIIECAGDITRRFHHSLVWVECSELVQEGWTHSDGWFAPPVEVEVKPDPEAELEAAIQAELRTIALERLEAKGEITIDGQLTR
jgi:hypothetical protein